MAPEESWKAEKKKRKNERSISSMSKKLAEAWDIIKTRSEAWEQEMPKVLNLTTRADALKSDKIAMEDSAMPSTSIIEGRD